MDIVRYLTQIADQEIETIKLDFNAISPIEKTAFLIEACRTFDYWNIQENFTNNIDKKLCIQDFTIISRGWNCLLGILLPYIQNTSGIPLMESTSQSIKNMTAILLRLGNAIILKENANMIKHDMAKAEIEGDNISIKMTERCKIDHYLDRLDEDKLKDKNNKSYLKKYIIKNIDQRLNDLIFPFETSEGTMIGYGAEQDIDDHFLSLVMDLTIQLRNHAGIHPDVKICNALGKDIIAIGSLLMSFNLKHISFVNVGKKKIPHSNYFMSMTIWKPRSEIINSLYEYTGISKTRISAVIDIFTVNSSDYLYFVNEFTPYVPMFIKVSDEYLLSPVSSIFNNIFSGLRMFHASSSVAMASINKPREDWMISDLYHLFLGNRYRVLKKPVNLRKNGQIVTDIDAAIYDVTTGELALFQLKWQDFNSNDIQKQRSKAKNFVKQVDDWSEKILNWINEFGKEMLLRSLQISVDKSIEEVTIKYFVIGRSRARFQSYGYKPKLQELATSTWLQFIRLRQEIGSVDNVIESLHRKIIEESTQLLDLKSLPHKIRIKEKNIIFKDLWCSIDDEK